VFNGHNEDFGIVPIEANASGKPVLSRNEGFPGVFVGEGNGRLHDGKAGSIQRSIGEFAENHPTVDPGKHVSRFSIDTFSEKARDAIAGWHADLQRRVRQ
jgi:glycosyltransferase involved in cell wall biosynthesis